MNDPDQTSLQLSKRFVRLSPNERHLTVEVTGPSRTLLMPIPASRIDWLTAAAGRLWRQRRRCLAALLLLEPTSSHWTIRFPRQRCAEAGVHWSVTEHDFVGLGLHWVLGGTFQATSRQDGLAELVPTPDGLHFVLVHAESMAGLHAYIRAAGLLRPAGQHPVMINDWAAAIDAALPRLTLA